MSHGRTRVQLGRHATTPRNEYDVCTDPHRRGAGYGLVAGSLPRAPIVYGLPFGATVWASGYVVLPAAKLYQPIWTYDVKTLADDLSAHLMYGLVTAAAWRLA